MTLTNRLLERNEFSGKVGLADFIELLIFSFPRIPFTTTRLHALLGDMWGLEMHHLELAQTEMIRRSQIIGESYPFVFLNGVPVNRESSHHYLAMLALSHIQKSNVDESLLSDAYSAKAFEDLAEICLSDFYGAHTRTVNFGFPSEVGRPSEFGSAISWLSSKIGIQAGTSFRSPRRKDGGVDLVVWKSFGDSRSGIPILLVQVTLQHDIRSKSRDVDRRMWSGWLSMDIDPSVAISVPYVLENSEIWNEVTRNCLVLDRVRMASMLSHTSREIPASLATSIEALTSEMKKTYEEFF
jgi:hypothetical protein